MADRSRTTADRPRTTGDRPRGWRASVRGATALFVLGTLGVVAVAVDSVPVLRAIPELESLPFLALVLLAAVNSTLLLIVFTTLGSAAAPRIGLTSHVFAWASGGTLDWAALRRSIPLAVVTGASLFAVVAVLDVASAPFVRLPAGEVVADADDLGALAPSIPVRLLYGGITEEILLRWGIMAPIAFVLWRVGRAVGGGTGGGAEAGTETPSAATMWVAILASAVLFGLGHLPVLASSIGLTPALIVRTVLLNAIVGVALGWLFWRRSLETAMVAHAAFHVALLVVGAIAIRLL
ncbi:CPBP family intramembrane glutamic endopeptidase [Halorubrum cibi]|uniref:CAAX protease self-immunity n=1 Tax=Halorubrum cibi TaxID=413815 RepID=A0A521BUU6_9EURY|nr:CPBP family intramembrane glutamic endopeptidase [Halorubrum cibi]SMO50441.1 CAAX protease self-immunity [Halorubrum cibi]